MARQSLVGYYGKLAQAAQSAITTGTLVEGSKYIVETIGGSSALPTGVEVGKGFVSDGTEDITSSGDEVILLTETDKCDITQWSIEFTKGEADVTTLCDDNNVYLATRTDISGTLEGVYKIGVTDVDGGIANNFMSIVQQAGEGGAVTVNDLDDSTFVLMLYKQKDQTAGETEQLYIAPVTAGSFSDTINGADAQTFSTSFRIAPDPVIDFHLLSILHS